MKIRVAVQGNAQEGFVAFVPSLKGCISGGATIEDALVNLREALELYLEPVDDDLVQLEGVHLEEMVV